MWDANEKSERKLIKRENYFKRKQSYLNIYVCIWSSETGFLSSEVADVQIYNCYFLICVILCLYLYVKVLASAKPV